MVAIRLAILSGKSAGTDWVGSSLPVRLGRDAASDVVLEEDGVWDQHVQIGFYPGEGFLLRCRPQSPVSINSQRTGQALLRNGDVIEIGAAKVQFWLGETRQPGLRLREALTWAGIAGVFAAQIGLMYWLWR